MERKYNDIIRKNRRAMLETITASLDDTQKNAVDTVTTVQQVLEMSGKELHEKTISAILEDDKLNASEKIVLIHSENADYDRHQENNTERVVRLQDTQAKNVGDATGWWANNWGRVFFGVVTGWAVLTPQGRKFLRYTYRLIA